MRIIEHILSRRKEDGRGVLVRNLDAMSNMYSAMRAVLECSPAERFLIMRGSNGGGVPKPGSEFFITVMHEEHSDPDHAGLAKDRYNKLMVDSQYIDMLREVAVKGDARIKTADLPPGMLRTFYDAEKVKYSEIYLLKLSKTEIYYCSIAAYADVNFDDPEMRSTIISNVGRIREIFREL